MVLVEQDPNARFEKAIFNLLRSFNYIELNIGLLIASIAKPQFSAEVHKKLSRKSFEQKIRWFRSLLKEGEIHQHVGKKGVSEFEAWYLHAHKARELRNRYVHAIWRFNPMQRGSPVSISSPVWMKDVLGGELNEAMTLDELELKATMIDNVLKDLLKLIKKYRI